MSLNRVFLLGNLGADPELRYSASQMPICNLRVATNDRRKGNDGEWVDHTEWHRVITFGKTAENCAQYLKKGGSAFIEGRIQTRKWQDQDGKDRYSTEIVANTVQFVGSKNQGFEGDRAPSGSNNRQAQAVVNDSSLGEPVSFDDDDIPF